MWLFSLAAVAKAIMLCGSGRAGRSATAVPRQELQLKRTADIFRADLNTAVAERLALPVKCPSRRSMTIQQGSQGSDGADVVNAVTLRGA